MYVYTFILYQPSSNLLGTLKHITGDIARSYLCKQTPLTGLYLRPTASFTDKW